LTVPKLGGESSRVSLVEPLDLQKSLELPDLPGEVDLLDAWSLYYRGRQSDAVRSIVTSIEVLLEARLRNALAKRGLTESEVQSRLDENWNNFHARLMEYVRATGRRLPGPVVSVIPVINGVRLRDELEQVRKLRHKIVHGGERVAYPFGGQMQRVMDTMSWLFNWLAEDSRQGKHRIEARALAPSMRGILAFESEYTPSGVLVVPRKLDGPAILAEEELRNQLVAAVEKETADIEKFAFMAIRRIGFERSIDTPSPQSASSFLFERLILSDGGSFVPLFLYDTNETPNSDLIERIAARVLALKSQGQPFSLALLIVNTQNGLEWAHREIGEAVSDSAVEIASQCGIGIVTTVDLLLLIRGAEAQLWCFAEIKKSLMRAGRVGCEPPGYVYAGYLRTFYDRLRVASIVLEQSASLRVGDSLIIRLAERYYRQTIDSMQVNRAPVTEAHGCTVGIQTTLRRSEVGVGDYVFVRAAGLEASSSTKELP
jgi:hypothetical protein